MEINTDARYTVINGDLAIYTGESRDIAGGTFFTVRFVEGHRIGTTRLTSREPSDPMNDAHTAAAMEQAK